MEIVNRTHFAVEGLLREAIAEHPAEGLLVEVKYCRQGAKWPASGTYYRRANGRPGGKLIRVRINRANRYPVRMLFKTSSYFKRRNGRGEEMTYQRMRKASLRSPEELVCAIFLHEFSHYLDHVAGGNGRYKQTKADEFALSGLARLGIRV